MSSTFYVHCSLQDQPSSWVQSTQGIWGRGDEASETAFWLIITDLSQEWEGLCDLVLVQGQAREWTGVLSSPTLQVPISKSLKEIYGLCRGWTK